MKIILHIGMPKAGSSALQVGLSAMRDELSRVGLLYPVGGGHPYKHSLLIHGLVDVERLPRKLLQKYDGDAYAIGQAMLAWLIRLEETVTVKAPHTLILSAEDLFKVVTHDGITKLANRLHGLSEEVEVVAYVRRPSEQYLASVQQTLKASHRIAAPHPIAYRPTLESYAEHITDRVHVIKYDPTSWPGGDILRHFLANFVPRGEKANTGPLQQVNRSLSAEAMDLLVEYRRRYWPENNNRFTPDTNLLIDALLAADNEVGGNSRPLLHEHIREAVDYDTVDLLWLRDEHSIVFDDVIYDRIRSTQRTHPVPGGIDEICVVDRTRKTQLERRVQSNVKQRPIEWPQVAKTWSKYLIRRIARLFQAR